MPGVEQTKFAERKQNWHGVGMYWTGAHTKHQLKYHLVWVPKYRKRVLKGKIAKRIYELFGICAEMNRWGIEELNVQEDHIHMLIQLRPNVSVSKAVQMFKGGSSIVIRAEYPELEEFLWGNSFWADGYFADSVGKCDEEIIRKYIREQ